MCQEVLDAFLFSRGAERFWDPTGTGALSRYRQLLLGVGRQRRLSLRESSVHQSNCLLSDGRARERLAVGPRALVAYRQLGLGPDAGAFGSHRVTKRVLFHMLRAN